MNLKEKYSRWIKEEAPRLGFITCGIAKASFLEEEAPRLERWLNRKRHAGLHYMENHFDKRLDPRLLVEGAQSVISLLYNYYPSKKQRTDTYRISKSAYGQDYHHVLKSKLRTLHDFITERIGEVHGRAFVDSAPVLDKAWAERAGLGWVGKNTLLLQKQRGSFHFVCELIVDLKLAYDQPVTDHCGNCKRCIDACPTQAIVRPYEIDASRCISYMTIELKDQIIPSGSEEKFQDWIFGCDICQDVCPWNRFSQPTESPLLQPQDETWLDFSKRDWEEITEEVFQKIFKKSALKRAKYTGFKRNINYVKRSKEQTTTY